MTLLDWFIISVYFIIAGAIGVAFTRRAGRNIAEFFVSGRSLPWWLAGTSMVATTFAVDTPLAVAGMVASNGVAGNWLWWNMVMSGILTVFFYAHLWRRAEVLTDAEFTEVRYSGGPAALLRGFRAAYMAVPVNLIIMGWVNLAMITILNVVLGISPVQSFIFLFVLTMTYAALSGMWGVVVTDFIQFGIAMIGSIVLAVYATNAVGGLDGLVERLPERFGSADAALAILPQGGAAWMPASALLIFLSVQWWATYYPGSEPGGGGYVAQRIFSARTERDGVLATLWFNIAHYAVRPWPWIVTALAVAVLYPGTDPADAYVRAVVELLPPGVTGLLLAAFAAAYMSTISTQLNWGASYLVNDLYKRFVEPDASDRKLVLVARLATAGVFLLSAGFTWWLYRFGSIDAAWRILIALGAGTGLVYILRWYWWRINAWSEISAMVASFVLFVALTVGNVFDPRDTEQAALLTLVITILTTEVWIAITFVTRPTPEATLVAFYRRVRPGGIGWRRIAAVAGFPRERVAGGALSWVNWIAGVVSVYATLFGVGKILFGSVIEAVAYLTVAAVAFAWIGWSLRRMEPARRTPLPPPPEEVAVVTPG